MRGLRRAEPASAVSQSLSARRSTGAAGGIPISLERASPLPAGGRSSLHRQALRGDRHAPPASGPFAGGRRFDEERTDWHRHPSGRTPGRRASWSRAHLCARHRSGGRGTRPASARCFHWAGTDDEWLRSPSKVGEDDPDRAAGWAQARGGPGPALTYLVPGDRALSAEVYTSMVGIPAASLRPPRSTGRARGEDWNAPPAWSLGDAPVPVSWIARSGAADRFGPAAGGPKKGEDLQRFALQRLTAGRVVQQRTRWRVRSWNRGLLQLELLGDAGVDERLHRVLAESLEAAPARTRRQILTPATPGR